MEPWIAVLAVVGMVLLTALKWWSRGRLRAAREQRTGSREPSTVGAHVVAALFTAFGTYLLVFQFDDVTKGIPGWLSGSFLVVGSVAMAVEAYRRRRMARESGAQRGVEDPGRKGAP